MSKSGQCYYCDHAETYNNTHVLCNRLKRKTSKLDRCVKHKDRSLDKDVINPPKPENDDDNY